MSHLHDLLSKSRAVQVLQARRAWQSPRKLGDSFVGLSALLAMTLSIRSKRRGAKAPRQYQRAKVYHGTTVLSRNYNELFCFSYSVRIPLRDPATIDSSGMPEDQTAAP